MIKKWHEVRCCRSLGFKCLGAVTFKSMACELNPQLTAVFYSRGHGLLCFQTPWLPRITVASLGKKTWADALGKLQSPFDFERLPSKRETTLQQSKCCAFLLHSRQGCGMLVSGSLLFLFSSWNIFRPLTVWSMRRSTSNRLNQASRESAAENSSSAGSSTAT